VVKKVQKKMFEQKSEDKQFVFKINKDAGGPNKNKQKIVSDFFVRAFCLESQFLGVAVIYMTAKF